MPPIRLPWHPATFSLDIMQDKIISLSTSHFFLSLSSCLVQQMLHRLTPKKPWKRPSPELKGEKVHRKVNSSNCNHYFRDNFLAAQEKTKFQYEVKLLETHLGKQWGRFIYTVEGASGTTDVPEFISLCSYLVTIEHSLKKKKKNQLYWYTEMISGTIREKIWEINFFLISTFGENKENKEIKRLKLHIEKSCLW